MSSSSTALPRPFTRLGVVLLTVSTALGASVGVASAHVSVSSSDAAPGGYGKLTFRVPNESDTASTVALRIQIPEDAAMSSLRFQPVPGWTATLTESDLATPIKAGDREISSYVSLVEFRADAGSGIAPGEFQEFALSGGPFPEADALTLPTIQVYSDGSETAWIEPTVDGQARPERPAPVLSLAPAAVATDANEAAAGHPAGAGDSHDATSEPAGLALFL
ncbi:MAG: uncharacterized protein JWP33_2504, partial [Blastococcus sp.]|nr:uncharacterized protein [Blastococcus sp.]